MHGEQTSLDCVFVEMCLKRHIDLCQASTPDTLDGVRFVSLGIVSVFVALMQPFKSRKAFCLSVGLLSAHLLLYLPASLQVSVYEAAPVAHLEAVGGRQMA